MSAEHGLTEAIDKSAVNGQGMTKDESLEVDGDEDSGDEGVPQGESTNTSSKKKKKKKPKKKVSHQKLCTTGSAKKTRRQLRILYLALYLPKHRHHRQNRKGTD
jgi:hypothetical protein